jgi:hypothetical protein
LGGLNEEIIKLVATLDTTGMDAGVSRIISNFKTIAKASEVIQPKATKALIKTSPYNVTGDMGRAINVAGKKGISSYSGLEEGSEKYKQNLQDAAMRMVGIISLVKELSTEEYRINGYLRAQNLENTLIAKKKLNMVSIAGVLIDKNNAVYKLDEGIRNETQILLNKQMSLNRMYDFEIQSKKQILALGIRNKNISVEDLTLLKSSIVELERRKRTELQSLGGRAMGIVGKMEAGTPEGLDAQRLAIITKYEEAQKRITVQQRLQNVEQGILDSTTRGSISVYGEILNYNEEIWKTSKVFGEAQSKLAYEVEALNQKYIEELNIKTKILNKMKEMNVPPEILEAATNDILQVEKRRVIEQERLKKLAHEINQTALATRSTEYAPTGLISMEEAEIKAKKALLSHNLATKEATTLMEKQSQAEIRLGGATRGMIKQFSILRNRLLVLTFAFAGLVRMGKKWIDLSLQAIKRETSLSIISTNLGISISDVTKATKELASDGVLSINGATQAVKNLLSTGASLKIVTETINVLKDAALANGRDFFTAEENITSFTQGLKEGRSQVTDNIGVMTNLSVVAKKYKDIIKEVGYANGILIGFMKEAAMYEGTRAKLMQTLAGRMMFLKTAVLELKISLGTVLQPVMENILGLFEVWTKKIKEFSDTNKFKISEYVDYVGKSIKSVMELVINSTVNIMKIFSVFSSTVVGVFGILKGVLGIKNISWLISIIISLKIIIVLTKSLIKFMTALKNTFKSIIALEFMQNLIPTTHRKNFITALYEITGSFNKLKFSIKQIWALSPKIPWLMGVTVLLGVAINSIGTLIRKKRELESIDKERSTYSKTLYEDTEKQTEVIKAMDKVLRNRNITVPTIKMIDPDQLKADLDKSAQTLITSTTSTIFDVQKEVNKQIKGKNISIIESFFPDKEQSDELDFLKKMGFAYDALTGDIIQFNTKNETMFRMSYENFKRLNAIILKYADKIGPIPQFQDDLSSAVDETSNKIKELQNQIDALEVPSLTKDFKDIFKTFKEGKENIDGLKTRLDSLKTSLNGIILERVNLKNDLIALSATLKDPIPESVINDLADIGLKNADTMFLKLKEYLGVTDEGTKLIYQLLFGQLKVQLKEFEKNINDLKLDLTNSYDDYIQELSGLNEQINLAKTGSEKGSIASAMLKEDIKIAKERLDIQQKYTKVIDDTNTELANAKTYLTDLVAKDKELGLTMESPEVKKQLEEIARLEAAILSITGKRVDLEKLMNQILGVRKELIFWNEYNEFMTSAESKYNDLVGNAENGPGLLTQWMFGGKSARGNIREQGQKILNDLIRQAEDIKKQSISMSESIKSPELANGKTIISDTEMKALDDWVEKLKNMSPVMASMGKEIVDAANQMAQGVTNAFLQMIDANRQLNEQMYSTRIELKRQRELGVISEDEYNTEIKKSEEQAYYDRKAASHRQLQGLAVSIRDTLAAKAVEWAIMAIAYKVFAAGDTAMMVFPNPVGKLAVAAQYATLAALAGGGAIAMNSVASSQGMKAAYWEGMGAAEASKYDETSSSTETGSKGSTSGSTIAAQPQYITINPSVAFYGDYLYLGDTIQEVGEKMSRVIVTEVKEAIETGEITLSNFN